MVNIYNTTLNIVLRVMSCIILGQIDRDLIQWAAWEIE